MELSAETPLSEVPFVVFDTETTGLSPDGDAVIEIAALRVSGGMIHEAETFHSLVNPVRPIPFDVQQVHGITDAEVADAQLFEAVLPQFMAFAEDGVLVAHNAPFDLGFVNKTLRDMGWGQWEGPVVCTAVLSRTLYPTERRHDLDTIIHRLALPPVTRHRAAGDVLQTARAFLRFCEDLSRGGKATFGALDAARVL